MLDIINDRDEVIGQAERAEVHKKGLLFRMVYVSFTTPDERLILQRRSLLKKVNAGRLGMAVIGHVTSGETYLEAAVKEVHEETGLTIEPSALIELDRGYSSNKEGDYLSNAMRVLYKYQFAGDITDLRVEQGEALGFEITTLDNLKAAISQNRTNYVPYFADVVERGLLDPS